MAGITVQNDESHGVYRLVGPAGEEGEITDHGTPATVVVQNATYMSFIDCDGLPDEDLGAAVYRLVAVETTAEDVEFSGPGMEEEEVEEEGEEEEEEGDEDEEEEDDGTDDDGTELVVEEEEEEGDEEESDNQPQEELS